MHVGIDASRIALKELTGTENYTANLIESIKQIDKDNKYTLYFNNLPQYFEINQPNVSTLYIPLPRLWTQARLAFECLINPPDLLFVPAHTIPVIRRPGLKTVVTIHDLGAEFLAQYHQFPQKYYLNWSTGYVARHASHIIAVSESTKKDLVKQFRIDPSRVTVIHEAVNQRFYKKAERNDIEQVRNKYGLKKPYVLYVGTIQPRKNLIKLMEAFSKLNNKNIELVLVGKPGWLFEDIYEAPKKFGVEDQVKFLGYIDQDELPAFYSGAESFVFPSLYEGFGLPVLEAMACGTPVLTSNTSSLPEITGGNAVLVNPKSTKAIAEGLKTILEDSELKLRLIAAGLKWVKNFTWEKTAQQTIGVFEQVYQLGKKDEN